MTTDVSTTNMFLGIIAISNLIEMLAISVACVGLFLVARRLLQLIKAVKEQQLAPAAERVHAILDDVKGVTSTVKTQTDRIESLARWTLSAVRRCGGDV